MAYALRAYYEQENNFGVTDRIEIHEDGFAGSTIELSGRAPLAFDFEHRESTGRQRDYLSLFENPIIMGVLDFYPHINSTAKETLVTDIADAVTEQFRVEWKRDGTTVWYGYPYGRIVEYPDKPQYNVKLQFRDFELLKGIQYTLDDTRQKVITTLSDLFGQLSFGLSIYTITSWQEENTTTTDDFLNQVYHDTYALRQYAGDGFANDQTITYYEALERTLDPMLVAFQWQGFRVNQISGLKDPSSALLSEYNSSGVQQSSSSQDIRQTVYQSESAGTPSAKAITKNTSYPALKRAVYEFNHRSGSSQITFPLTEGYAGFIFTDSQVDFDGEDHVIATQPFSGNGDETLVFSGEFYSGSSSEDAKATVSVDDKFLDSNYEWIDGTNFDTVGIFSTTFMVFNNTGVNTSTGELTMNSDNDNLATGVPVRIYTDGTMPTGLSEGETYWVIDYVNSPPSATTFKLSDTRGGSAIVPSDSGSGSFYVFDLRLSFPLEPRSGFTTTYYGDFKVESEDIPDSAEGDVEVILLLQSGGDGQWYNMDVFIKDPTIAGRSIEYRLTQVNDYPDEFRLNDSFFGDGPYPYSKSSYRFSTTLGDITTGWRRRGETTYIGYSNLKLREVLDFQRVRQIKKSFHLWGEFDPTDVSVYDSDNYMYLGGRYNARWNPIMVKIDENLDA